MATIRLRQSPSVAAGSFDSFLKGGAVAFVAAMVVGCAACGTIGWSQGFQHGLLTLGGVASAAVLGLEIAARRNPNRWRDLTDASLLTPALGGIVLAVVASATGVRPCPLCIAFWSCVGGSLARLVFSERSLSRIAVASLLVVAACAVAILASPPTSRLIASFVPPIPVEEAGPLIGTRVPDGIALPQNGIVAIVTDCIPCLTQSLTRSVEALRAKGKPVTLAASYTNWKAMKQFPSLAFVGLQARDFPRLRMTPKGTPRIIQVRQGVVVCSAPPHLFTPAEAIQP